MKRTEAVAFGLLKDLNILFEGVLNYTAEKLFIFCFLQNCYPSFFMAYKSGLWHLLSFVIRHNFREWI